MNWLIWLGIKAWRRLWRFPCLDAMNWLIWLGFFAIFIGVVPLGLGVLHREAKAMHVKQALGWTVVWICVALSFAGLVYGVYEYQWFGWRAFGEDSPDGVQE